MRQLSLDLIITHLCQLVGGPDYILRALQQACILGNGNCGFFTVTGNHYYLHTSLLYRLNSLHCLRTHVITDGNNTGKRQSFIRQVISRYSLIGAHCQHSHCLSRKLQHSVIQSSFHLISQRQTLTVIGPIPIGSLQQLFRCALNQAICCAAIRGSNLCPGIFIGTVKRNKALALRQLRQTIGTDIIV